MYFIVIPKYIKAYAVYGLPPSFFPKVISAAIFIFSVILMIQGAAAAKGSLFAFADVKKSLSSADRRPLKNILTIISLFVLYLAGLYTIGFLFSTPVILFVIARAFGWKRYVVLAVVSLIVTAVLYYLFGTVLGSPLP